MIINNNINDSNNKIHVFIDINNDRLTNVVRIILC